MDKIEELKKFFDEFKKIIKIKGFCKVIKILMTKNGFSRSEEMVIKDITNEDFYYLTHQTYRINIRKELKIANDEPPPPYFENDIVEFIPKKFKLENDILYIFYEEN